MGRHKFSDSWVVSSDLVAPRQQSTITSIALCILYVSSADLGLLIRFCFSQNSGGCDAIYFGGRPFQ